MILTSWTMALSLAVVSAPGLTARWLGQDGHDYTSATPQLKPNGYQDIHVILHGIPPDREVSRVKIDGEGGGAWLYPGTPPILAAALVRPARSRMADLYLEPDHLEKGRSFFLHVELDNGMKLSAVVRGGKADPRRRMPGTEPRATWAGQDGQDRVGFGPSVGPDGIQDVRIALAQLEPKVEIRTVDLEATGGLHWESGLNPKALPNAELVRDPSDPSKGNLWLQPDRDLTGSTLRLSLAYANNKTDTVTIACGRCDPKLAMPAPQLPKVIPSTIRARWLGQDSADGDVHVALSDIPADRPISAFVLSDGMRGLWVHRSDSRVSLEGMERATPLQVRLGADRSKADLRFLPYRNEVGRTLTLRLVFQDESIAFAQFEGGACDPLRGQQPTVATTSTTAHPGDDLNDLVSRFGTVTLSAGTYPMARPLILTRPTTITGGRDAVLLFSQSGSEPSWTAAIKIHSGSTTLNGFTIRFDGPIRWRTEVSYGPAVVGTSDNFDGGFSDAKIGVTFSGLDIETPPAADPSGWQEAPRMLRLINAQHVRIANNVLKGGQIEGCDGPWEFVDNDYRGTPPGTFTHGVFVVHGPHDVLVRGNRAKPVGPYGKTWRFVVFTGGGRRVQVLDNRIEQIGPRDDDTIPSMNAGEIILTESYHLAFEGRPAAVTSDGRIVRITGAQGTPPSPGNLVSVLSGAHAGEWRPIAQVLSPNTFLLETPLPRDSRVISIAGGFTDFRVEGNTIDSRAGRFAANLVLAGNHFGTIIRKNRLLGGGEAFRIQACASEAPVHWGWSHVPFLGGVFEENLIEDSTRGGLFGVEHNQAIKSTLGRVYMTVRLQNNRVRWSSEFLAEEARERKKKPLNAIAFGYLPSFDPGELVVSERGTMLDAPTGFVQGDTLRVNSALYNDHRFYKKAFRLPTPQGSPELSRASKP